MGEVTTYAYDELGNVIERRTPGGVTTYAYDPVGMLVRATARTPSWKSSGTSWAGSSGSRSTGARSRTPSTSSPCGGTRRPEWTVRGPSTAPATRRPWTVAGHVVTFRYDEAGREIERTTGDSAVLTQSFDAEHQLTGQIVTARTGANSRIVQQRRYQYHVDGQLVGVDDAISGPVRFQLDPAGRVTDVAAPNGAESYRYDPSGNIVSAIVKAQLPAAGPARPDAELGPRHYAGNSLSAAGSVRYAYDPQGRLPPARRPALASGHGPTAGISWTASSACAHRTEPCGGTATTRSAGESQSNASCRAGRRVRWWPRRSSSSGAANSWSSRCTGTSAASGL